MTAYIIDTHVGAMSELIACATCAKPYQDGPAEDCRPLTAEDIALLDANDPDWPHVCECCEVAL